ncbi:MAG: DNA replication/repair protein RecF [Candidatus Zixiibacteriota bacterium]|nr:MAG: DNA replication/repair protein RecF [candidate division Zixibacteria bacterium]
MFLKTLHVVNFRNLAELASEFGEGVNILHGGNGSGKTNILEAIFVLHLGRSHRGASEATLVREGAEYYRIEGQTVVDGENRDVAVAYDRGGRKKLTIDGLAVRLVELYGAFCAVSLGPEDSNILSGPPSARRRFIDLYLSQYSGKYLTVLADYHKVLAQKNAALRKEMDPQPFNELLAESGARLINSRREHIENLGNSTAAYYRRISGGGELSVGYRPSTAAAAAESDISEIKRAFEKALRVMAEKEKITQTALVGPHRDDVQIELNGLPARTHGSQGEWRSAAVALKLAVYDMLRGRRGTPPLLLLDEVFAELDINRSEALMEALGNLGQLFLTTALEPPEFLKESGRCYRVANGQIAGVD